MRHLVSGRRLGVTNGLLLWPCGHSELNEAVAAGVLLWRGGPFSFVLERTGGRLASMVNMRVASEKINVKRCGGLTKCKGNITYVLVQVLV